MSPASPLPLIAHAPVIAVAKSWIRLYLIIDQFRAEVNEKKIDYQFMKKRLDNFEENKVDFTVLIENENSSEQLQVIDKSILAYALVEKNINEIPKEVVIDECIRLAKKFSNEKAYKYVNAKADILYDL